jgi:DNA-binding MarR family transcriptional regulator
MTQVDLLRFVPFRLNRLAAEISRDLGATYAEQFGIDITEWRVLATLGMREPRSAQFIVRCTRTHKSKISRAVTRLALAGLVEGVANSDDRREVQLKMTKKGRALYERLAPIVLGYEQRLLANLSQAERQGLAQGLDKLEQALGLVRSPDECP